MPEKYPGGIACNFMEHGEITKQQVAPWNRGRLADRQAETLAQRGHYQQIRAAIGRRERGVVCVG